MTINDEQYNRMEAKSLKIDKNLFNAMLNDKEI
jgi:hypothetical protein